MPRPANPQPELKENLKGTMSDDVAEVLNSSGNTDDVNDGVTVVGLVKTITVASIGCKPKPAQNDKGEYITYNYGTKEAPVIKPLYPDQDLCIMAGRATGFSFVATDKGESVLLHGDLVATNLTPDHNGEIETKTASAQMILPNIAEQLLLAGFAKEGLPLSMSDVQETSTDDRGTRKTKMFPLENPATFSFIIGARAANNAYGYTYTVKAVQQAKKEISQSDMLLEQALKKRRILALAAPDSKHAEG
jgi:hypothetical protein